MTIAEFISRFLDTLVQLLHAILDLFGVNHIPNTSGSRTTPSTPSGRDGKSGGPEVPSQRNVYRLPVSYGIADANTFRYPDYVGQNHAVSGINTNISAHTTLGAPQGRFNLSTPKQQYTLYLEPATVQQPTDRAIQTYLLINNMSNVYNLELCWIEIRISSFSIQQINSSQVIMYWREISRNTCVLTTGNEQIRLTHASVKEAVAVMEQPIKEPLSRETVRRAAGTRRQKIRRPKPSLDRIAYAAGGSERRERIRV